MKISVGEIIVVGMVLLIIFSASRMGSLGNALGKFVYSFKKASKGQDFIDVTPSTIQRKTSGFKKDVEDTEHKS